MSVGIKWGFIIIHSGVVWENEFKQSPCIQSVWILTLPMISQWKRGHISITIVGTCIDLLFMRTVKNRGKKEKVLPLYVSDERRYYVEL